MYSTGTPSPERVVPWVAPINVRRADELCDFVTDVTIVKQLSRAPRGVTGGRTPGYWPSNARRITSAAPGAGMVSASTSDLSRSAAAITAGERRSR
jgi:hypothetical protein